VATALAITATVGAWAQERPTGVKVADKVEVTATVEAIDLAQRLVTVSGPGKDRSVTVRVGSEVPDLDKLTIGDRVAITHSAAIVAEIKRPGAAARAAREGPSAESGERTVVVVVDAVDADENTVRVLRNVLHPMDELAAVEFLLSKLQDTKTNTDFFESMKR
jgi:hypothetical protein